MILRECAGVWIENRPKTESGVRQLNRALFIQRHNIQLLCSLVGLATRGSQLRVRFPGGVQHVLEREERVLEFARDEAVTSISPELFSTDASDKERTAGNGHGERASRDEKDLNDFLVRVIRGTERFLKDEHVRSARAYGCCPHAYVLSSSGCASGSDTFKPWPVGFLYFGYYDGSILFPSVEYSCRVF